MPSLSFIISLNSFTRQHYYKSAHLKLKQYTGYPTKIILGVNKRFHGTVSVCRYPLINHDRLLVKGKHLLLRNSDLLLGGHYGHFLLYGLILSNGRLNSRYLKYIVTGGGSTNLKGS